MPILTQQEQDGPVWQKLKAALEQRLESHRRSNDSPSLTPEETAHLRGKIAAIKKILDDEQADHVGSVEFTNNQTGGY